jgi:hypothetical protein
MFTNVVLAVAAALAGLPAGSADISPPPRQPHPEVYAQPADLFVSPSGSDEGDCTSAAPCRTFNRAYQVARPGDVVEIAGGSYPSQVIGAKADAAPPHVTIREGAGERAIVGNPGARNDCLVFEGAQYVTVAGFETTYTTVDGQAHQCGVAVGRSNAHDIRLVDIDAGMIWFGADDVTVLGGDFGPGVDENTKIEFATGHPPRNIVIDGAVIHDARRSRLHQECVALWGGDGITIRNTHMYNCAVFHLWIVAAAGDTIRNVLIANNLFTQPDSSVETSSAVKVGDHGGMLENIVLRGNRVLTDEVFVVAGYDEGGTGNIRVLDNQTKEPISLGSGENCMVDATYSPKPGVRYECRGNELVTAPILLHHPR